MSVIKHVVAEEKDRLERLIKNYEKKINEYPKGSVVEKKISGKSYAYSMQRQGKKIVTNYIGKSDSKAVSEVRAKIAQRKKIEKQLKEAKLNYIHVLKLLK